MAAMTNIPEFLPNLTLTSNCLLAGCPSRAIKGIDEDMKLNKALWEMAEVLRNRGAQ